MHTVTLTGEEAARVARHSQWLGLDGLRPIPASIFRAFLVEMLTRRAPELARKVSGLSDDALEQLRDDLRGRQAFGRSLVFG